MVAFEDVAVTFSQEEWQQLDEAQRTLYKDVMLEAYSSLVAAGHCRSKPEVIVKLEQGAEPWMGEEPAPRTLSDVPAVDDPMENNQKIPNRHCWQAVINSSKLPTMKRTDLGKMLHLGPTRVMKGDNAFIKIPEVHKACHSSFPPCEPSEMLHREESEDCGGTAKSLSSPDHSCVSRMTSAWQPLEWNGQGGALNKESTCSPSGRAPSGESASTHGKYEQACDTSPLTAQQRSHTGQIPSRCDRWGGTVFEKPVQWNLYRDFENRLQKHKQRGCVFSNELRLLQLSKTDLNSKPFDCDTYGQRLQNLSQLSQPQQIHTAEYPYSCQKLREISALPARQKSLPGEKLFECQECGKSFSQKTNLYRHQKSHTGEKPYECTDCRKTFSRKGNLIVHQRTHTGERPYECQECRRTFSQKSVLITHQRIHTGEKPYECEDCTKAFYKKSDLTAHQRIHTGKDLYQCKECKKAFCHKAGLRLHQRAHTGEKPYECRECGKGFSWKGGLILHRRSHTGEKPYTCKECGKSFSQKITLTRHESAHTGLKPYACQECRKMFSQKTYLAVHQKSHTGEKPYKCKDCRKTFCQKAELCAHQSSHSGERRYECRECRKTFSQKSVLVEHHRTHTGEKPHACRECAKTFCKKSNLTVHQRTHTGEKPYTCHECTKTFYQKSNLLRHQRIHTRATP
ncbi:zinc finger protein 260-like [Erinaceus europaeus]|uniref:Zinc finger protein 260-like n=1 Tax=Erinaceus europaeus TaxID=9365 RepID=A0ABM3WLW8_ERIEU|nr:zinc finger protein 260-like [Erinaceus europaeus]